MTEPTSGHSVPMGATSIDSMLSDARQKELRMIAKRRFLMGLPLTEPQQEVIEDHKHSWLPESLVRDNDTFCEKVKMEVMGAVHPITQQTNLSLDVGVWGALHADPILKRFGELPPQVLCIMERKLKGEREGNPSIPKDRYKYATSVLIEKVGRECRELLSSNRGDELPAPLARALETARIFLKHKDGHHTFLEKGFVHVEERMRKLQNETSIAIKLLKEKVKKVNKVPSADVSSVLSLLGSKALVKERGQRAVVKKLLEEYLCECSFMRWVPEPLVKALAVIHKSNEAKREGILSLSATMKQVLLDTLPDHDFDKDYEELGKSEKEDDIEDVCDSMFDTVSDSDDSEGSGVGDYVPGDSKFSSIIPEQDSSLQKSVGAGSTSTGQGVGGGDGFLQNPSSSKNSENLAVEQPHNTYLGIQEACDNTSFIASNLIKRILKGVEEGVGEKQKGKRKASVGRDLAGPVIIQAVEELMPSVSNSTMKKLKDLMDRREAGL